MLWVTLEIQLRYDISIVSYIGVAFSVFLCNYSLKFATTVEKG